MEPIEGAEHLASLGPAEKMYGIPLPFTPAVRIAAGAELVFAAGVLGPATPEDPDESIEAEVRRAYANLAEVLRQSGGSMADIVYLTKYLKNMERDNEIVAVETERAIPHLVASTTIEISRFVPPHLHFEVAAIAAIRPQA